MQSQHRNEPFTQYRLERYNQHLSQLPQMEHSVRVRVLAQGCLKRKEKKLYMGDRSYIQDLQVVLDHDRDLAPLILKELKIMVSKDGTVVLNQCIDCGKYMPPFKYCGKCQHSHYCSQACEMRSKLGHQGSCRPRQLPAIDAALQVELHVGGDLGREAEVYYQHQMRTSLKLRGQSLVNSLFDYFLKQGKDRLPQDCRPEVINGHLRMKRSLEGVTTSSSGKSLVPNSLDGVAEVYSSNPMLGLLAEQLLYQGAIMTHLVRQAHNNHLHMIYIFLMGCLFEGI